MRNSGAVTVLSIVCLMGRSFGRPQQTADGRIFGDEELGLELDFITTTPSNILDSVNGGLNNENILRPVIGGRIRDSNGANGPAIEVAGEFNTNFQPLSSGIIQPSVDITSPEEPSPDQVNGRPKPVLKPNVVSTIDSKPPSPITQQINGNGRPSSTEIKKPMNYQFEYNVNQEEYENFYGHRESGQNGRVDGTYYNWLPNGRLMRVDYYVDGDSGFRPTITYLNDYQPTWGSRYFDRK